MKKTENIKTFEEIISPISQELSLIDRIIKEKLKTGIPIIDETSLHLFAGGGKRMRASLVILSSRLFNYRNDDIIEIAAAAEIIHAATLIHDDIIDQAAMRRGNISVPEKWGPQISVLAGDYMYATSLDIAIDTGNSKLFPPMVKASRNMIKGELYQLQYSNIDSINREHYLKIIELKTARFMAACSELGAIIADRPDDDRAGLYDFGLNLGFGFQIIDDTLDLIESGNLTGKDYGNDLMEGKITLPVIFYIDTLESGEKKAFKEKLKNINKDSISSVLSEIRDSDVIERTVKTAESYIKKALSQLEKLPESVYKTILKDIADFIIYRKH